MCEYEKASHFSHSRRRAVYFYSRRTHAAPGTRNRKSPSPGLDPNQVPAQPRCALPASQSTHLLYTRNPSVPEKKRRPIDAAAPETRMLIKLTTSPHHETIPDLVPNFGNQQKQKWQVQQTKKGNFFSKELRPCTKSGTEPAHIYFLIRKFRNTKGGPRAQGRG